MFACSLCAVLQLSGGGSNRVSCLSSPPLSQQTPQGSEPLVEAWTAQAAQEGICPLILFYPSPSSLLLLGCSLTTHALAR